MRWVVDAVSDGVARVIQENGAATFLPAWLLPPGTRAGAVLRVTHEAEPGAVTLRIEIDAAATDEARRAIQAQLARAAETDAGGDIEISS